MSDMTFEQVLQSAKQLSPEEQAMLLEQLKEMLQPEPDYGVTPEQLDVELAQLQASGAFDNVESLYGKYANPAVVWEDGELKAVIHEIRNQKKEDFEEFAYKKGK